MSSASLGSAPHPGPLPASGAGKGCNLSRDDPATAIRDTATAFPRPAHGEISVSLNSLLTGKVSRFNREFGTENSRRRKAGKEGDNRHICSCYVPYQEVRSKISLGADLDDETADRIDAGTVAGVEHDRRRDFLDDRRPGDLIAGEERLAMPDRRLLPSAAARSLRLEIDPARPWRASCGGSRPPEGGRGNSGVSMRPVAV